MKKFYLVLILSFFLAVTANAETNFYVGGGVGASMFSGSKHGDLYAPPPALYSIRINGEMVPFKEEFSGKDITGKIFAGFRASQYSAVEFSLHRFGKPDALMTRKSTNLLNLAYSENFKAEEITNSYMVQGMSLSLLAIYPASDTFELFGKVGLLYSKIYSTAPINAQKINQNAVQDKGGFDETGFAVLLGGGTNINITKNLSLRVEFEFSPDVADEHEQRAKDVIKAINKKLKDRGIQEKVTYDVDLNIKSTTASIIWNF